jgi:hypothetical protein
MTHIKCALPGPQIDSGRRWLLLLSCGHQVEIVAGRSKAPRGEHACEICALRDANGEDETTGPLSVFGADNRPS